MSVTILKEKCRGCRLCLKICPFDAIRMDDGKAVINYDKCTNCGACEISCKFEAILVEREEKGKDGHISI